MLGKRFLVGFRGGGGTVIVETDEIPGLAGHPDRLPDTPNADDEEYDVAVDGAWALFGSGSPTEDTTTPSHLHLTAPATGSVLLRGYRRAIPSMPFTVTTKISAHTLDNTQTHAPFVGLGLFEESSGKSYHLILNLTGSGNNVSIKTQYWSSLTGGTITDGHATPTSTGLALLRPVYLRLVVTSASVIRAYFSYDGLLFTPTYTATEDPGFTFDKVGYAMYAATLSTPVELMSDWIRFS